MKQNRRADLKKNLFGTIGTLLILYGIMTNMISSTKVAFSNEVVLFGILLIIYNILCIKFKESKRFKSINKVIKIGLAILLLAFAIIEMTIIVYPKNNRDKADYTIVLGAGLRNGYEPTITLKDRLDAAIDVSRGGYIVVSGGQGHDESISEAEAMKKYLKLKGIDESKIIVEDKSTNTFENLKYSKEKVEDFSKLSISDLEIKIVTTDFHGCRSSLIARRNGYKNHNIYTSKSLNYLIPIYYFREGFAMIKTIIFDH